MGNDPIRELEARVGEAWPFLHSCGENALQNRQRIAERLIKERKAVPADTSLVVFGSIARGEWTSGSDVDWTLLVDGQAHPEHAGVIPTIQEELKVAGFPPPGPTGTFGTLTFSHDLVHQIGGEEDTNKNTTRRMLLLLESQEIGDERSSAHSRVVRAVIHRYLREEANLTRGDSYKVPRFLLNDVVRYWRVIAVDFANKHSDRGIKGWGLRNLKLQTSRKLIFICGLLMCFAPNLFLKCNSKGSREEHQDNLIDFLERYVRYTPLQVLAESLNRLGADKKLALRVFSSYEKFLMFMDNKTTRERLKSVGPFEARTDRTYADGRAIASEFEKGVLELFFDTEPLKQLTRKYGLF